MTAAGGDLRRVRRPVRPRDADPRARGADRRLERGEGRRRLSRGAGRARPDVRRSPVADHAGGAVRTRPAGLPQARGPEPHRRAQDQQRARSGRPRRSGSGSAGSSPRRGPASTASRPRPPAHGSGSSAWCTWAPRTCAGRRRTSSGCVSSAPPSSRSRRGRGRSRRRRAQRSATGSRTSRRPTT